MDHYVPVPEGWAFKIFKWICILLTIAWCGFMLTGCSSKPVIPQTQEEKYAYTVEKSEEALDDERCRYPDGSYNLAPDWVCEDKGGLESVSSFPKGVAGVQHAKNLAIAHGLREIALRTQAKIQSSLKAYTSGGNHLDEDVIKMTVNKTIQGAQVTNMITSPDGDVYVRIVAKGVSDYISDKGQREAIERAFEELKEESGG